MPALARDTGLETRDTADLEVGATKSARGIPATCGAKSGN